MMNTLRSGTRTASLGFFLLVGAVSASAQEITWVETKFHRVHLINGNFIDGQVLKVSDSDVYMRLPVGDMIIRKDSVDRIELMKMRSIQERPKLDPPLKKAAPAKSAEPVQRLKSQATFAPAPASPEVIENVGRLLSRMKIAKPDQRDGLVDMLARQEQAGAYIASLLPTADEETASMLRSALMRSREPESLPYLVRALESDKSFVKIHAITLLGILGNLDHAASIRPFLNESVPAVKATAIEALQQLNDPASVPAIAELVGESDDMVRLAAINASVELGRTHNRMDLVAESVRRHLNGSEGRMAKELMSAVSRARMKDLWQFVVPFLNDADPMLRKTAASTLQTLAVPESADAVVIRLDSEDDVRTLIELAKAASTLKAQAAIPSLIRHLGDTNDNVVQSSAAALILLTRQKFGTNQSKWTEWWNRNNAR